MNLRYALLLAQPWCSFCCGRLSGGEQIRLLMRPQKSSSFVGSAIRFFYQPAIPLHGYCRSGRSPVRNTGLNLQLLLLLSFEAGLPAPCIGRLLPKNRYSISILFPSAPEGPVAENPQRSTVIMAGMLGMCVMIHGKGYRLTTSSTQAA
jgi:hypothetical protein